MIRMLIAISLLAASAGASAASPVIADPPADAANPASMEAFVMPSQDGAMNAVLYRAAGAGSHPTLLLLHGFPGNEQNLDLAQAARRAGWNVLTLHYRGSWGSPGAFSFTHAAEDAHSALAWLRDPANGQLHGINPARIALAGHSMGGFMAADAAADDPQVIGLFLLDSLDFADAVRALETPEGRAAWHAEVVSDLPPLAGTSEQALTKEMIGSASSFDLRRRLAAYGDRPLAVYGAERGNGDMNTGYMDAARQAGNGHVTGAVWPTDHSFSDKRIALSEALVAWLVTLR
jgi:pimeloyl-ACP methyl ester carboxylesterase